MVFFISLPLSFIKILILQIIASVLKRELGIHQAPEKQLAQYWLVLVSLQYCQG